MLPRFLSALAKLHEKQVSNYRSSYGHGEIQPLAELVVPQQAVGDGLSVGAGSSHAPEAAAAPLHQFPAIATLRPLDARLRLRFSEMKGLRVTVTTRRGKTFIVFKNPARVLASRTGQGQDDPTSKFTDREVEASCFAVVVGGERFIADNHNDGEI